jgi:hypothetical protein
VRRGRSPHGLPGLTKRYDGLWYYRRQVPRELRAKLDLREVVISLETKDEAEARAKVAEVAKRVEQRFHDAKLALLEQKTQPPRDYTDVPPEQGTLSMLFDAWGDEDGAVLVERARRGGILGDIYRKPTLEEYRETERAVARFVQVIGDLPVGQVTPVTLRRFKRKLETTPHHSTGKPLDYRAVTATMTALRTLLRWYKDGVEGRLE